MGRHEIGRNGQVEDKRMNALAGRGDKRRHDDNRSAVPAAEKTIEGGKRSTEDNAIHAAQCRGDNVGTETKITSVSAAKTIEGGKSSFGSNDQNAARCRGRNRGRGAILPVTTILRMPPAPVPRRPECRRRPRAQVLRWYQNTRCARGRNHRSRQAAP